MQDSDFILGRDYTRRQIHEQLGGSVISYLPTSRGAVVCACLKPDLNRKAPEVILVGYGAGIERAGDLLSRQREPVPVFVKRDTNCWTFRGLWKVRDSSQSPDVIEAESGDSRRGTVSRVVFMEKVGG